MNVVKLASSSPGQVRRFRITSTLLFGAMASSWSLTHRDQVAEQEIYQ
jgi:hypothetical protein